MTTPSVGRIVHYTSHGSPVRADGTQAYKPECRAAMITAVGCDEHPAGCVSLFVANPTGIFLNEHDPYDAERAGGSWHWPERV